MKPIKECKSLQEVFVSPDRWTKQAFYRDKDGKTLDYSSPTSRVKNATSCCILGAIDIVYPDNSDSIISKLSENLKMKAFVHAGITEWNDHPSRTFEEIQEIVKELDI